MAHLKSLNIYSFTCALLFFIIDAFSFRLCVESICRLFAPGCWFETTGPWNLDLLVLFLSFVCVFFSHTRMLL